MKDITIKNIDIDDITKIQSVDKDFDQMLEAVKPKQSILDLLEPTQ